MSPTLHQVCLHHPLREAAARCPSCSHFFCRECVTEHEDRVICNSCLQAEARQPGQSGSRWRGWLARACIAGAGLCLAWMLFYALALVLLRIPVEVHDGGYWDSAISSPP